MAKIVTYTKDELAKHVGQRFAEDDRPSSEKMLIAIDDYVYDITKFGMFHPGGLAVLKMHAGTDCTKAFYGLHTKAALEKYHDKLVVGRYLGDGGTSSETTLKLPEKDAEDLISTVPYSEIPLLRSNWARMPWWTDSHRDFLVAFRAACQPLVEECIESERDEEFVSSELAQKFGKNGMLACLNGLAAMKVAQKLQDEGKITLPGGLQPRDFDIWHEYIAHTEFSHSFPQGVRQGLAGGMVISLPAIAQYAKNMHPDQQDQIVGDVLLGTKRSCLAISEPQAGSDVAGLVTVARKSKCGNFYIVNGIKKWITAGINADYFSTAVRTGGKGAAGLSFLLIDKNHPRSKDGIDVKYIKTSDAKGAGTCWVYFDDCYVPVENLMGKENGGFKLMMANFNHERWMICAWVLSGARAVLKDCMLWANQREVFGKKLINQPVIRQKLGRMIGAIESLEGHLQFITYQLDKMDKFTQMLELGGATAILKYQSTRVLTMVCDEACQIFGGRALTKSGMGEKVEMAQRTFKFASILGGSEEIMADLGVRQAMMLFPDDARL